MSGTRDEKSPFLELLVKFWQIVLTAVALIAVAAQTQSAVAQQGIRLTAVEQSVPLIREDVSAIKQAQIDQRDILRHMDHRLDILTDRK